MKQLELKQLIKEAVKEALNDSLQGIVKKAVKESLKESIKARKTSNITKEVNRTPIKKVNDTPFTSFQQLMEDTRKSMSREDYKNVLGGDNVMTDLEGNPVSKDHPTLSLLTKDYSHII